MGRNRNFKTEEELEGFFECHYCPKNSEFTSYSRKELELHEIGVHGILDSRSYDSASSRSPSPPRKRYPLDRDHRDSYHLDRCSSGEIYEKMYRHRNLSPLKENLFLFTEERILSCSILHR